MNHKISITLVIVLAPLVMLSHISVSKKENGWLFDVDGRNVDLIGIIQEKWRKTTTRCDAVKKLPSTDAHHIAIQKLVQSYSPPDSENIKNLHVWSTQNWAVAEVEFERLLPAVVTINGSEANPSIVEGAIWSGLTSPWKSGPFIRTYLGNRSLATPKVLLDCFELQTQSFQ